MESDKAAFIINGHFPVPATKGGAVEALIQNIIDENEEKALMELTVFSFKAFQKLQEVYWTVLLPYP